MLFGSASKWWGDRGKRKTGHEGLDLFLYRNNVGDILRLAENTSVPVIYDGKVIKIINDFLGKSIFMEHGNRLITVYGHITPLEGIKVGTKVKEGDVIATIAKISSNKIKIAPHLHITAGWISEEISPETLDWKRVANSKMVRLIDPLDIIKSGSPILKGSLPVCNDL